MTVSITAVERNALRELLETIGVIDKNGPVGWRQLLAAKLLMNLDKQYKMDNSRFVYTLDQLAIILHPRFNEALSDQQEKWREEAHILLPVLVDFSSRDNGTMVRVTQLTLKAKDLLVLYKDTSAPITRDVSEVRQTYGGRNGRHIAVGLNPPEEFLAAKSALDKTNGDCKAKANKEEVLRDYKTGRISPALASKVLGRSLPMLTSSAPATVLPSAPAALPAASETP